MGNNCLIIGIPHRELQPLMLQHSEGTFSNLQASSSLCSCYTEGLGYSCMFHTQSHLIVRWKWLVIYLISKWDFGTIWWTYEQLEGQCTAMMQDKSIFTPCNLKESLNQICVITFVHDNSYPPLLTFIPPGKIV